MNRERGVPICLSLLLLVATLGEGGGSPLSLLIWHGCLVLLLVAVLVGNLDDKLAGAAPAFPLVGFAAFLLIFAFGAVRAPYAYGALLVALELAAWTAVALTAARAGADLLPVLIPVLRVGAAAQAFYGLYQWLVLDHRRPAGTFLNTNLLALWLVAVLLVAVGVRLGRPVADVARRPLWREAWWVVPSCAAIWLTGSRGAMLGLLCGAGWLAAAGWRRLPRRARVAIACIGVVLIGLVAVRQAGRLRDPDPFRYHRLRIWKASLGAALDDPFWGTGPGQFETAAKNLRFPDGEGPLRYDRSFSVTHSDVLRVPCELGIPATLVLAVVVVGTGFSVSRRRRAGRPPSGAEGVMAALIALAAHAAVDNPSRWPAAYLLGATLVGILLSVRSSGGPRAGRPVRVGLAVVLAAVFVVADVAPYLAWSRAAGLPRGRLDEAGRSRLAGALRLNPIHPDYRARRAEDFLGDGSDWDLEAYSAARESAEHAVRLSPADSRNRLVLARVEERACRTFLRDAGTCARAVDGYREAAALARFDPFILVGLAGLLLDTDDPEGARRAASRALALEPESVLPRLLLAAALIDSRSDESVRMAERLIDEAKQRADRWSDQLDDWPYARALLHLDPEIVSRLERGIAESVDRESDP